MRSDIEKIHQQKVNQVIDYISAHLHRPLALDVLAGRMCVSVRQLLRIMSSSLNEPLSAYVARQRLERAVMYMQAEEMSLTNLSEMVGYDNPQSFSKAFKKQFGTSPKAYMNELQARLKTYAKSDGNHLPAEICEEDDLDLVYIRIIGKYGDSEPYEAAWQKLVTFLMNQQAFSEATRFIGISFDDPNVTRPDRCRFYACASVQKKITPTGAFGTIRLRKGKYAVFTLKGSYSGLKDLYNNINVNFDFVLRHGIAFEEYLNNAYTTKEEDLLTKIFVPIK